MNDFYKKLISIAIPIATQQLIVSSLNLVDIFMISTLSNEAIAGVGAANKLFFLLNLFLFGMSSGSSILTAQFWGAKDIKSIKKVYGLSLTFAMAGALLFTLLAVMVPSQVMRVFTPDTAVIEEGASYLRIVGLSYIFTSVTFVTFFRPQEHQQGQASHVRDDHCHFHEHVLQLGSDLRKARIQSHGC